MNGLRWVVAVSIGLALCLGSWVGRVADARDIAGPCGTDEFRSRGRCYAVAGECGAYDGTSGVVCDNAHDALACSWRPASRACVPEFPGKGGCAAGEVASDGRCRAPADSCGDYRDAVACGSNADRLSCRWNDRREVCLPSGVAAVVPDAGDSCGRDEFHTKDGCRRKETDCSGYDGTAAGVCHNLADDLDCVWDAASERCRPSGMTMRMGVVTAGPGGEDAGDGGPADAADSAGSAGAGSGGDSAAAP